MSAALFGGRRVGKKPDEQEEEVSPTEDLNAWSTEQRTDLIREVLAWLDKTPG